ncbi:MAG: ribosome-binding factor A [Candidatus Brennerbacteria bacterium RIFOXYB1_FULL_41_13]|uniref:Ribosome-binding factor A n=1 Tax=Candidatus Brennerbacteria bacterium RIFOXYD1_FULL_41_16 TaxID=1797529 RepID=A0A1G1XKC4_9BACT|nr:MAG: Ribosome-binding factor A [Parcubacteria group bacterium GW2011_GWB1_41_4]OGY39166.1 MAG: ribosome-binding factor A [Candidatus Brennerbacteria bacterium RIFOXYB1_FULL_41_13]OGY40553.1 MAG: ribosome-binding factor A [Candidatus Brennerbacteria bacterium RIFOXYD1_FULL_41_16]
MPEKPKPRILRLEEHILEELGTIIKKEFDDPSQSFISLTKVNLGSDISHATVFISVFPESNKDNVIERLNRAHGFLQAKLYERLSTYNLPKLFFKYDPSIIQESQLHDLIEKTKNK